MIQYLHIPDWHPTPLNELVGCGIGKRNRLKRGDADLVALYAYQQGLEKATGPHRVAIKITLGPAQRGCDPDAYGKSTLDALKRAGLLVDDDRFRVVSDPPTYDRGPRRATTIVLTDIDIEKPKRARKRKGAPDASRR